MKYAVQQLAVFGDDVGTKDIRIHDVVINVKERVVPSTITIAKATEAAKIKTKNDEYDHTDPAHQFVQRQCGYQSILQ